MAKFLLCPMISLVFSPQDRKVSPGCCRWCFLQNLRVSNCTFLVVAICAMVKRWPAGYWRIRFGAPQTLYSLRKEHLITGWGSTVGCDYPRYVVQCFCFFWCMVCHFHLASLPCSSHLICPSAKYASLGYGSVSARVCQKMDSILGDCHQPNEKA